ncbi:MAG: N-acetylmuramoyl-L-alanine amidase, partial [Deltaproteobacteria bacterium]|nr:N-acetylmuramoyl-L-alanine amidase [Deltaproteobacteria bacterium]
MAVLFGLLGWAHGGAAGVAVVERPVPFGETRTALTLEYIRAHYDPAASSIAIVPRMIVVHWTGSRTLVSALETFRSERLAGRPELARAGEVNVSAHYLVDRNGTIYHLVPDSRMARHVIGLNRSAIGIENVGGPRDPLTSAQLEANARLVRELKQKYPDLRYLIGHHEYGRFRGTPLWEERDPSYFTGKQDPGPDFMKRLRERVSDLGLSSAWTSKEPCSAVVLGESRCAVP